MTLCVRSVAEASRTRLPGLPLTFRRHKSLRAVIERGIQDYEATISSKRTRREQLRSYNNEGGPTRSAHNSFAPLQDSKIWRPVRLRQDEQENDSSDVPEAFPYTTAASEFIYGYSAVYAAIKAFRRKLYKLYIHDRGQNNAEIAKLVARARACKIDIHKVGPEYLRLMDKASSGRPHNGFILESSPLPRPPIVRMGPVSVDVGYFKVELDWQSREDAQVNGRQTQYTYKSAGWRHPLLLYVDGVLDEGNLGAIARSAYFLGVDALATPSRQSAPWTNVALKASAGAAEAIPIFCVDNPSEFLGDSARDGWRIYASDAIPQEKESDLSSPSPPGSQPPAEGGVVFTFARSTKRLPPNHSPVGTAPTILMMGAEDTGLRPSLLNQAHYKVGIRAGQMEDEIGVDSLNVSAAASILCFEFLKKPNQPARQSRDKLF